MSFFVKYNQVKLDSGEGDPKLNLVELIPSRGTMYPQWAPSLGACHCYPSLKEVWVLHWLDIR